MSSTEPEWDENAEFERESAAREKAIKEYEMRENEAVFLRVIPRHVLDWLRGLSQEDIRRLEEGKI